MTSRLAALSLALAALPALAQDAGLPEPHPVPLGATGNVVELLIDRPEDAASSPLVVVLAASPSWVVVPERTAAVAQGSVEAATFTFDVGREAEVGDETSLTFEVRAGPEGPVLGVHTVRLEVAPPTALALGLPYPNPVRGDVRVPFDLPSTGPVRLVVLDVLGREVAVLAEGEMDLGSHEAEFTSGDVAAGVYFVRLTSGDPSGPPPLVRRLTVVR